jgi:hypothetical protein
MQKGLHCWVRIQVDKCEAPFLNSNFGCVFYQLKMDMQALQQHVQPI